MRCELSAPHDHADHDTAHHWRSSDLSRGLAPNVGKLLEEGRIPYEKPNRHRYVQLADLEAYRQERAVQRREALNEFSRLAADFGPDGITFEEAAAAVEKIRKTRSR